MISLTAPPQAPFVNDPKFGEIVDYEFVKSHLSKVLDNVYPNFDMLGCMTTSTEWYNDEANAMTAVAASGFAYMMLVAAGETELAAKHKGQIFTLGWTEEHTGTDLLSAYTHATPMSDDPDERQFHLKGHKWVINNSYHADYHMIVAKTDPEQNGPRSLSIFIVPHSSTKNWQRLETHILDKMVITEYDVDGPGTLVGKVGQGLSIIQSIANPCKYICSYLGLVMVRRALPATIDHLATKRIFSENPIQFTNVFRQMYNLCLQESLIEFTLNRGVAMSDGPFLAFYGAMMKSWLLLRTNEILRENLLVAGSKGFLRESVIGRHAMDSFVLPVFDGHYTLNTLMTAKHLKRYIHADDAPNMEERLNFLRENMYHHFSGNQLHIPARKVKNPPFVNFVEAINQLNLPIDLNAQNLIIRVRSLVDELDATELSSDTDIRYKLGMVLHNLEALVASCELWAMTDNEHYLNGIVIQYNALVKVFNNLISESSLQTPFLTPMRQQPMDMPDDPVNFLLSLMDVQAQL